jgi:hypothetical protein
VSYDGKECKAKENGEETISIYSVMDKFYQGLYQG